MYLDENKHRIVTLPAIGSWPKAVHEFDLEDMWAVNAALASHRPLLLRGEPGTGKSQLARAVATALGRIHLSYVVNARTESRDLQFQYDALARLAEAQTANLAATSETERKSLLEGLHASHFLEPGILWWAFSWQSAENQYKACKSKGLSPAQPEGSNMTRGSVVLIDEIDKADADVPNGLLETLGNGSFTVPYTHTKVSAAKPNPLVVITTNEERELPSAFLRRCLIHHLKLPQDEAPFKAKLIERGRLRYESALDSELIQRAAELLWKDRSVALESQDKAPGQAEFFDMLEALMNLKKAGMDPMEAMKKIEGFIFKKYRPGMTGL